LIPRLALACCLATALAGSAAYAAESTSSKTIQAIRTDTPPKIDGVLDDAVWQKAAVVEDLHEVSPNEFSETSEPSRYFVLYDQNAIYVAVRLWESNPDSVTAKMLRKGDLSFGDDTITVLLDPHNDGRSGYFFDLNPNGVRNEGLYTDVTAENWAWQGIWNGAAGQDSEGWVAELEIPFKTLSFDPSNDTWGINFMRWRGQAGEWYGWVSGNSSVNPAYAGKLQGLAGLDQGLGLDIIPGLRISESKDFTTSLSSTDVEPSIDVFYKLTTALTAALTVNTDFSGTGADARQINLSRFSLFFPERRNFFLQDTDIFEFGRIGAEENYFPTTLSRVEKQSGRPFFSRRIGLSDSGEAVDLDIGGKMTGRIGRWDIGILDIQQASHFSVDSTNLFVGRAAARVFEESMLGVIVTNGDPTSNDDNTLIGVDFRYLNTRLKSGRTIEGAMWYQQTDTTGLNGDDAAFGVSLKMPSAEGFRGGVSFKELQANYYPALGFVNRVDVRDYTAEFGHFWRPANEAINGIYSGIDAQRIDTIAGELQSQVITYRPFEIELSSSDFLVFEYWHNKEQLVEDFPIHEDPILGIINIPPGLYSFGYYCIGTGSGPHRSLAGQFWYCDGEFFDGDSVSASAELTWRPSPHFKFSILYDVNDIELPDGKFTTRLSSIRADIAFTNTWSWENFIQWDNVSNSLGVNSILRWLPRAGREMVFVINREFDDPNRTRSFHSTYSDIAFKFSYTFRY
jgi:hypothetical protein